MADEATRLFEGQCPVPTGNTLLDARPLSNILWTLIRKTNFVVAIICGTVSIREKVNVPFRE